MKGIKITEENLLAIQQIVTEGPRQELPFRPFRIWNKEKDQLIDLRYVKRVGDIKLNIGDIVYVSELK